MVNQITSNLKTKENHLTNSNRPSSSIKRANTPNPSSNKLRQTPNSVTTQKREKLKNLLMQKIMKKFKLIDGKIIEKELNDFVQNEKLTEIGLKQFEDKIKNLLEIKNFTIMNSKINEENINKDENKLNVTDKAYSKTSNNYDDAISMTSSDISNIYEDKTLKYEEISNFGLRKLLQNEKKPMVRHDFSKYGSEWKAIAEYKKKIDEENTKNNRLIDKQTKNTTRIKFDEQIKEKDDKQENIRKIEDNYYKDMLSNLDKLEKDENRKVKEIKEKKLKEKKIREYQMKDNINNKKNQFLSDREFDNKLSNLTLI